MEINGICSNTKYNITGIKLPWVGLDIDGCKYLTGHATCDNRVTFLIAMLYYKF